MVVEIQYRSVVVKDLYLYYHPPLYMSMSNGVFVLRTSFSLYSACGLVCTVVTVVYISLTCDSLTNIIYKLQVMKPTCLHAKSWLHLLREYFTKVPETTFVETWLTNS